MITNSPYGFGVGRVSIGLSQIPDKPFQSPFIPIYDTPEEIERCLNCTEPASRCDRCRYSREAARQRGKHKRAGARKRAALATDAEKKTSENVARMVLDGWREPAIARELGLSLDEVNSAIELARCNQLLY